MDHRRANFIKRFARRVNFNKRFARKDGVSRFNRVRPVPGAMGKWQRRPFRRHRDLLPGRGVVCFSSGPFVLEYDARGTERL